MSQPKVIQPTQLNISDLANLWLKDYKLNYKLTQEFLDFEIDTAIDEYYSKNYEIKNSRPDIKLLLQDKDLNYYPILIKYKEHKDKLVKLDLDGQVKNKTSKNELSLFNINEYAVNGAVHYANALLHYTSYTDIIAIGIIGYKDANGQPQYKIEVYYVSKSNFGVEQKVGEYSDFSFLAPENFNEFVAQIKNLVLTPQKLEKIKSQKEKEIDAVLLQINNYFYQNEKNLTEDDILCLIIASIIATLGVHGKVLPLKASDLPSNDNTGHTDGDIILQKIQNVLESKQFFKKNQEIVLSVLSKTLLAKHINQVENGESQIKRVFTTIVNNLGIYYKIGLNIDFTGKVFNNMYKWSKFSQDKLNDVVLTPSYVATLLVKLARVNKDSFVWDFATGSAGLLVVAMNEMLDDAQNSIQSSLVLAQKENKIKNEQILGLEILPSVYMLAVVNMFLIGGNGLNILNQNSLDFDGKYSFDNTNKQFPANAFILNPPYSASGNGMVFVEKALNMMQTGYAAIIIQSSAGSGKAQDFNKRILQKHTLEASIKMPYNLFAEKADVYTHIYVFRVGEKHNPQTRVKFIDFSNDGYTRTNRKKSSNNLKDTGNAKERYQEIVDLVRFGKSKLKIFSEKEYYENTIDPNNGADWNQTAPIDTKPTLADFKKTVGDYLAWEVSNILKNQKPDDRLGK